MNAAPSLPEPVEGQATSPEDDKIIKLARAARARTGAAEGACIRDTDGRTYAATTVDLPHLKLSAVAVAVAMGVSSGAPGLEAVALVGDSSLTEADRAVITDLGGDAVAILQAGPDGVLRD
ncbi:cytidine deaminase [Microlunatus speluncae]|uniref:cytidine deaminase n=1 Tax=Microlunatus speluncae TaxID=2594267 RepID=UPI00126606F8|nr:cytidine deaminase [Microlunatus speluncae]